MTRCRLTMALALAAVLGPLTARAATLAPDAAPDAALASALRVEIRQVGPAVPGGGNNLASPVLAGDRLLFTDQANAQIWRQTDLGLEALVTPDKLPAGITLKGGGSIRNIAASPDGTALYVLFTASFDTPGAPPVADLPAPLPEAPYDDLYAIGGQVHHMLYRYDLSETGIANPAPVLAVGVQRGGQAHMGGGLLALPDGRVLLATGDALSNGTDGRAAPQDDAEQVGKLLIIDPADGSFEVAAKGFRNVQTLSFEDPQTPDRIVFADLGSNTAEEINQITLDDLLDTSVVENFGWGRNADGLAREGMFYIAPGTPLVTGPDPVGLAPVDEAGFRQPVAQIGREGAPLVAITGPVTSTQSFTTITSLFSDLVTGQMFATLDPLTGIDLPVYKVTLVGPDGQPLTLLDLVGLSRVDPRFFRFADGSAGVLLERNRSVYRLTQLPDAAPSAVPLPGALVGLGAGLAALAGLRRRQRRQG